MSSRSRHGPRPESRENKRSPLTHTHTHRPLLISHPPPSAYPTMSTQAKFDRAVAIVQGLPKDGPVRPEQKDQLVVRFLYAFSLGRDGGSKTPHSSTSTTSRVGSPPLFVRLREEWFHISKSIRPDVARQNGRPLVYSIRYEGRTPRGHSLGKLRHRLVLLDCFVWKPFTPIC